jgi:methyl-accepting chemotaxis protein
VNLIKNMKIGIKLLSAFAIMAVFMGVIGYTGYKSVNGIQNDLEKIFSVQMPAIDYLIEADRDLQQLLVAERSMMFTDPNSKMFKQFVDEYEANFKQSDTRWKKYTALASTAAEKELFGVYQKAREAWQEDSRKVVQLAKSGNAQKAIALTLGEAKKHFEGMRDPIDKLTELNLELAKQASENAQATYKSAVAVLLTVILLGVAAGLALAWFISSQITRPVNTMVDGLKDIAQGEGDLTKRLEEGAKDELGELATWFNTFMDKLQQIIKDIAGGVETLSSSSTALSTISEQMSSGIANVSEKSNTVSAATEEMSTSINSMAAAMEQSATNTNMVATAAEEMSATIGEIAQNTEKARCISDEAAQKAATASTNMDQLGDAANSIGKVVETIAEISEQVNLLALNATIEAARAGEAGKGFAVVANEIKELAKQTAEASQDIKEKIEGIQGTTSTTVGQISEITRVITNVNDVVATIATAVEEQSTATTDIAANVSEASRGIQEVNENVNQSSSVSAEISRDIAEVSVSMNEMSTSSSQVNLSAQELSQLSENLKQLVDQFKV